MQPSGNPNIDAFNEDVVQNGGYRYTTNAQLSSQWANERLTKATLDLADMRGQHVLDIGCGDGSYTLELYDRGGPEFIHGLDPALSAVESARSHVGSRNINFATGSAYELPFATQSFDWAHLRGVLHHLDQPAVALGEALRVARHVVVIEPNGYSPILKVLEKVSPYHRQHDEKSYPASRLDGWVKAHGGTVSGRQFVGLVPMFCPQWMAKLAKTLEPLVEGTPVVRQLGCAVYAFVADSGNLAVSQPGSHSAAPRKVA